MQVLFPSAPRMVLSSPEAELPRSRDELWDLVGVPLKVSRCLMLSATYLYTSTGRVAGKLPRQLWHVRLSTLLLFSCLQLTPAEFDTIVSMAGGGGGGSGSVAQCMRARQALRPAAGAHIIS